MVYNKKRNIILAIIIFLAGIVTGGRLLVSKIMPQKLDNEVYRVISVIDGDTFKIADTTRVRLMGIDSPEKGECYYQEAKQALSDLILNKQVKLEKDITDQDYYGRLLRYAILQVKGGDNILINDYLVSNGLALATSIPPDKHYRELLQAGQEEARRNKLGLWSKCDYPKDNEAERREQDSKPDNPDCIIKGNISERGYGKTYLVPGCDNYNRVKIDKRKGEQYFCTEQEALQAGFRRATNCP